MNPIDYLIVALELTSLMMAVVFLIAWRSFGRRPHVLVWSAMFGLSTLQWGTNLLYSFGVVGLTLYWLTASAAAIGASSLLLVGYRLRAGQASGWRGLCAAGLTAEALILLFAGALPHEGLRTGIGPLYAGLLTALTLVPLLRGGGRTASERAVACVLAAFALCALIGAGIALSGGASLSDTTRRYYLVLNYVTAPAAITGLGLFTVLLIAADLSLEMKALALRDQLTGLLNRRGFNEAAERVHAASRRRGTVFSLVACDIDLFKEVNDRHGHSVGDEALRAFARCLQSGVRAQDIVGRYGGDEFVLVLPDTSAEQAMVLTERLRCACAQMQIDTGAASLRIRCSIGVAQAADTDHDFEAVLRRADAALYRAKQQGRDRVTVADPAFTGDVVEDGSDVMAPLVG